MKFKQYLQLVSEDGFIPTPRLRWVIRQNPRPTAREEAIAASVIEQANPRENITGHLGWGPEQQMVLQQMWAHESLQSEWREVPIEGAESFFTATDDGLPVPNAVRDPGQEIMDLQARLKELLGDNYDG